MACAVLVFEDYEVRRMEKVSGAREKSIWRRFVAFQIVFPRVRFFPRFLRRGANQGAWGGSRYDDDFYLKGKLRVE